MHCKKLAKLEHKIMYSVKKTQKLFLTERKRWSSIYTTSSVTFKKSFQKSDYGLLWVNA
jgi:hypothetical protein